MSKIDCLLNKCLWLLHDAKHLSNLDYLSRIDGEETAWYFWLTGIKGVYEFKLGYVENIGFSEHSCFYLKYYPDINEELFETYSCAEQFVRMGDLFEQTDVKIAEEHELCPCCGTNQCEHKHEHGPEPFVTRSKGIPKLLQRKILSPKLFCIGTIEFEIINDELSSLILTTESNLVQYAVNGFQIVDADGSPREIIGKNEIDRNIPGVSLCMPFHEFLLEKMLGILTVKSVQQTIVKEFGTVIFDFGNGDMRKKSSNAVEKVIVKNMF
ncbi:MAG: hypothetical protein WC127_05845 [Acidaminococcaceae bacterium]